jgi:hypothetical protein
MEKLFLFFITIGNAYPAIFALFHLTWIREQGGLIYEAIPLTPNDPNP